MSVNNAVQSWVQFSFKELVFVQSSNCILLVAWPETRCPPWFLAFLSHPASTPSAYCHLLLVPPFLPVPTTSTLV